MQILCQSFKNSKFFEERIGGQKALQGLPDVLTVRLVSLWLAPQLPFSAVVSTFCILSYEDFAILGKV